MEDVVVDGKSVGAVTSYTFEEVTENHTISATFKKIVEEKIDVEEIRLNQTEVSLPVSGTTVLTADILPEEATDKSIEWKSSNEEVAIVDQTGLVTALSRGEAVITAMAKDGSGVTAKCKISVIKAEQKLTGTTVYQKTNGDPVFYLDARISDGNGILSYQSTNPSVVSVDSSGKVTVTRAGTANVIVTASETEEYQSASLTVKITVAEKNESTEGIQKPAENKPSQGSQPQQENAPAAVRIPVIGTTFIDMASGASYRVTKAGVENKETVAGAEAAYVKSSAKAVQIIVPDYVTVNGVQYKVTSVLDNAFKNNKTVTKIKIGNNVTSIGASAFSGCKKLKSVTFGNHVTAIGNNAFKNCTSLKKVIIPAKVTSVGKNAFSGCKKLKNVIVKTKVLKNIGKNAFKGINKVAKIKVPKKRIKAYTKLFKKAKVAKTVKITK